MVEVVADTGHKRIKKFEIVDELLELGLLVELVEHHHYAHGVREVVVWDHIVLKA